MTDRRRLWAQLDEILNTGFNGQITLNCLNGVVSKYELRDIRPAPAVDPPEHRKAG